MYVLLNITAAEFVAAAHSLNALCEYAADYLPHSETSVFPVDSKRSLTAVSEAVLRAAATKLVGETIDGDYKTLLAVTIEHLAKMAPMDTADKASAGLPTPAPVVESAPKAPKAPKAEGEVAARPSKGATARVWEICDSVINAHTLPSGEINWSGLRGEAKQLAVAEGLNEGTFATQFGKWKKSKGN